MNKKIKKGLSAAMCALLSVVFITGCGGGDDTVIDTGNENNNGGGSSGGDTTTTVKTYDSETRAFTMAIGAIDGNFNPFFYTAQNDGTVASMTQASLLSTDENGDVVCGEDYPSVAKYYNIEEAADSTSTTYTFLIKNGMKFSDGYDLTVMDVLFSFYVYLDIAYTGSVTLYSTDIQGLNAYRQQDASLTNDSTLTNSTKFTNEGQQRLDAVIDYLEGHGTETTQVTKDIETIKTLFLEEVTSDWTTIESSFSSSYTEESFEYNFGEGDAWKYYYLNEGIISVYTTYNDSKNVVQLKYNDKYITTLEDYTKYTDYVFESQSTVGEEMEAIISDEEKIAQAMKDYNTTSRDEAIEYLKKETAINTVYETYTATDEGLLNIINYWSTGSDALEQFIGEQRSAYYQTLKDKNNGGLVVDHISGISVSRVTSFTDYDGTTHSLDAEYDQLTIVIDDIDPKAIYNFAITVCPMHYYSDNTHYTEAMADYTKYLTSKDGSDITHFGVELGDSTWYSEVVQASDKNRNPVGAGPYATSDQNGGDGTASTFWTNKYVYYKRNEYFETMGEGINNAKIKFVQYREMGDDKVLNALINREVDYGTPTANSSNQTTLSGYSSYLDATTLYNTSGYGYVGINPKYVNEYQVRQAIMKAMDTKMIVSDYYTADFADVIYRPMSMTSWAYPTGCTAYISEAKTSYAYTTNTSEIIALIEEAGYTVQTSKKNAQGVAIRANSAGDTLTYTFTIAGESTDHPAYQMFLKAETLLEQCGFDITVQTNVNALKDLNSGNLAVWAAAWTSSIDPDMYQVYHKDSTASSVKNWNYSEILNNTNGEWDYELAIVNSLSDYIDKARETNNRTTRKNLYSKALDLVMELAVELPTYQRKDNEVFVSTVLDRSTMTANPSTYVSLIDRIWEVDYL